MARTRLGQSAPYCAKCENYVGNLKDKFGSPCPNCGSLTVEYETFVRTRPNPAFDECDYADCGLWRKDHDAQQLGHRFREAA